MSSLVERLRVRSDRKPRSNLEYSDDEADLLPGKPGDQEKFERIDRADVVCYFILLVSLFSQTERKFMPSLWRNWGSIAVRNVCLYLPS
ncbi:CHD3-type chromatin-remodeling factor PICKLE [Quillaja saponaria]|uniref:CHD3-type chromatin-remodeling factor PICKLE n=1 Tax=Quillaja saponaria TaxID=32244 RepID=A0AAD7LJL2_QUISA|nr:CHD3-type chromatin-remodeling factor PICKLE [Quillaja saponaria]